MRYFLNAFIYLLNFVLVITPLYGRAGSPGDVGREAQNFAEGQVSLWNNLGDYSNGSYTFTTPDGETFSLSADDAAGNNLSEQIYPDGMNVDVGALEGAFNSDSKMGELGKSAKESLYTDAASDSPTSISGNAYKVLLSNEERNKPDLRNDPVLNGVRNQVYDQIDVWDNAFADCTETVNVKTTTNGLHLPDYKQCTRLNKPQGGCDIVHTIDLSVDPVDIVFVIDNSGSMKPVIDDLGKNVRAFANLLTNSADNYQDVRIGGVLMRDRSRRFELAPDISGFESFIFGIGIDKGPTYPFDDVANAANTFGWRNGVHRLIILIGNDDQGGNQAAAVNAINAKGITLYIFHNNHITKSIGTHLGDHFNGSALLKLAQFLTVVSDRWEPQSCIEDGKATFEEFCSGTYVATPPNDDACVNISGFEVCPGDGIYNQLKPPPLPNVPKQAERITVGALDCSFNAGTGSCWYNTAGEKVCVGGGDGSGEPADSCEVYEANTSCAFIESKCVDDGAGSAGNCYVFSDTYDCGYDVDAPSHEIDVGYSCDGELACLGEECLDFDRTSSPDFGKAMGLLNAAQFISQDMNCADQTGTGNVYCEVFAGEPMECSIALDDSVSNAVGFTQNCCDMPTGISLVDYMRLVMAVPKIDAAIVGLGQENLLSGAYQGLRNPVMSGWTEVTKPFTSFTENVSGYVDTMTQPIKDFAQEALQPLKDAMAEMFGNAAGSASSSASVAAGGTATSAQASEQAGKDMMTEILGTELSGLLSGIMTAYAVYSFALMAVQIVFACEEEHFMLASKIEMKSCTYVGSYCKTKVLGSCVEKRKGYCCFNSPLSRIIQEGARPQLGMSWGNSKSPSCEGIPAEHLSKIDWNLINWEEWMAILAATNQYPEVDPSMLNFDDVTGPGSDFDVFDYERLNTPDRTIERMEGINVDDKREEARDKVNYSVGKPDE